MLRFTEAQQRAINHARASFNAVQEAMASQYGITANSALDELFVHAAPIPLDAWRRVDAEAVRIQRDELVVFNSLAAASSQPVGIADLVSYFPKVSDSGGVHLSMDGRSQGSSDQAQIAYEGTPVPILNADPVRFGWRQMAGMNKGGGTLEQDSIFNAQRKVAEMMEDIALNGAPSIKMAGATPYGLRTFPQRKTGTHGLVLNGATGQEWLDAIKALIELNHSQKAYGRVTIYVNFSDWFYASNTEFAAGYPKTIAQRVREIEQVEAIVTSTRIPADELIGVASLSSRQWGKVLNAMPMTTRPKARHNPEDDYVFGVMAATAVQFRSDWDGNSQIAHMTRV